MSDKELFDKKFVYLEWDDVLKGKKVLAGDNLQLIRRDVNDGTAKVRYVEPYSDSNSSELYPFADDSGTTWSLVYYDPNYECKVAYAQGKTIQCKLNGSPFRWEDCTGKPKWLDTCEYRVKPEKKWRPFNDIRELKDTWYDKLPYPSLKTGLEEPFIWVRDKKRPDITRLITDFNAGCNCVAIAGQWHILEGLFDDYEFLDGTPCGAEEK